MLVFKGATLVGDVTEGNPGEGRPQGLPGDWGRVLGRMRREVGETAYRSWFEPMTVERMNGDEGVIAVPTRFLRDYVRTHYADRLLALWRSENHAVRRISFIVDPGPARGATRVPGRIPARPACPCRLLPRAAAPWTLSTTKACRRCSTRG